MPFETQWITGSNWFLGSITYVFWGKSYIVSKSIHYISNTSFLVWID